MNLLDMPATPDPGSAPVPSATFVKTRNPAITFVQRQRILELYFEDKGYPGYGKISTRSQQQQIPLTDEVKDKVLVIKPTELSTSFIQSVQKYLIWPSQEVNPKSFTKKIAGTLKDARKWENDNADIIARHENNLEEHNHKEKELKDKIEAAISSLKSLKDLYYYTSDKNFHFLHDADKEAGAKILSDCVPAIMQAKVLLNQGPKDLQRSLVEQIGYQEDILHRVHLVCQLEVFYKDWASKGGKLPWNAPSDAAPAADQETLQTRRNTYIPISDKASAKSGTSKDFKRLAGALIGTKVNQLLDVMSSMPDKKRPKVEPFIQDQEHDPELNNKIQENLRSLETLYLERAAQDFSRISTAPNEPQLLILGVHADKDAKHDACLPRNIPKEIDHSDEILRLFVAQRGIKTISAVRGVVTSKHATIFNS